MKLHYASSFVYPKVKTQRKYRLNLKKFQNKKVKPLLRREFSRRCVYCCIFDIWSNPENFSVEHYLPKKWFEHLQFSYSNLFYACISCNRKKKDFFPSNKNPGIFIPNPCDHVMFEHLQFSEDAVVGKTHQGDFTHKLLRLNSPMLKRIRESNIKAVQLAAVSLTDINLTIKKIKVALKATPSDLIRDDLKAANVERLSLLRHLKSLGAIPRK